MPPVRPTQFGLFGDEEPVGEPDVSPPEKQRASVSATSSESFDYPPNAFPPDPWDTLAAATLKDLEAAVGAPDAAIRAALCRYFKRGLAAGFDHGELVDLLCVSNELLAEAGFPDSEVDRILSTILSALTDREIAATVV